MEKSDVFKLLARIAELQDDLRNIDVQRRLALCDPQLVDTTVAELTTLRDVTRDVLDRLAQ